MIMNRANFIYNYNYNQMHMNSNDIFNQIGLVVSHQSECSFEELPRYTAYLEIQLSEGKNAILEIKNYDDPYTIAATFCRKHKLNELAIEIVENKIKQAKDNEEARLRNIKNSKKSPQKDKKALDKSGLSKDIYIGKNKNAKNDKESRSMINEKSKEKNQEKMKTEHISPNKRKQSKNNLKKSTEVKPSNNQPKVRKPNPNIGNELYARAMVKSKMLENERQKRQQQAQKQEQKQLTFQPKINPISAKIVQFRRENGDQSEKEKQKQNKKMILNQQRISQQVQQISECTFKPQINKVSNIIAKNKNSYKDEYDHFNTLYRQAQTRKDKLNAQIEEKQVKLFQPKINTKSSDKIKETFEQRLERSLIKKKQVKEASINSEEYPFQPKIGRAPKDNRNTKNNGDSSGLWSQLYSQKLKKSQTPSCSVEEYQPVQISQSSNIYYQNLVEKRINDVFSTLDSDEDGQISPDNISIEKLTKNELIFLKPIFQEMDELGAVLDYSEFKRAFLILLNDSDPHRKGVFLSEKPPKEERTSFTPQINKKSKQIALSRITTANGTIYQQLYEQGLKEIQKKQYKLQRQRAKIEERELEECSFKPQLNNTSKYYIEKVLGKKFNDQFDDEPLFQD